MVSKTRLILLSFCAGLIIGWLSLISVSTFIGFATDSSVGLRERTVRMSRTANGGQLYSGYKRLECHSCENSWELENDRAPLGFIVGVQKAGTSWLMKNLKAHPQIYRYPDGEPHVFDYQWEKFGDDDSANRCRVMQHYNNLLSAAPHPKMDGLVDKSPYYIVQSHIVPQRIMCAFPRTKIIIVLRNPVDRAYSHYQMRFRRTAEVEDVEDFEDFIENNIEELESLGLLNPDLTPQQEYELWSRVPSLMGNFVARGLYAIQIRQFLSVLMDHFGSDKVWDHLLILESEQMWKSPQAHLKRISEFLKLSSSVWKDMENEQSTYSSPMANSTRVRLENLYRPHNKKLHELLAPYGVEISWANAE